MGSSFILVFILHSILSLAAITPDPTSAITVLCDNANCVTRYTFSMTVATAIKSGALATVQFPQEFSTTNLGVVSCSGFAKVAGTRNAVSCMVSGNLVTWTLGTLAAGAVSLSLNDVVNPGLTGTTGYFQVQTFASAYLIESNQVFNTIGISPAPVSLSFSTLLTTAAAINVIQTYDLSFTPAILVLANAWLRVTFPSGFNLNGGLTCTVTTTAATQSACQVLETNSTYVNFAPLTANIPIGQSVRVSISGVQNPGFTGQTGYMTLQVLLGNSFSVQQISALLQTPLLSPGAVKNVLISGTPLTQGLQIWYTITATTSDPVPQGGYVRIIFPSEFGGVTNCVAATGFVATSSTGVVTCNFKKDFNTVYLTDFANLAPGTVTVRVQAVNPSVGTSSNFVVQTMLPSGNFIDANTQAGTLKFAAVPYPSSSNIDMFQVSVSQVLGQAGALELSLDCKSLLPPTPIIDTTSAIVGQIKVTLPASVLLMKGPLPTTYADASTDVGNTVSTNAKLSCLFGKNRNRAMRCDWDNTGKVITMDTPSLVGLESCPLAISVTMIGENGAALGFSFPSTPTTALGSQTVKVQTYIQTVSAALALKEEATLQILVPPKQFTSAVGVTAAGAVTLVSLHHTVGLANHIKADIKPSVSLPTAYNLQFEFTATGAFQPDMGLGLTTGQVASYPCFYSSAWGSFSSCSITVGSATTSTYIRLISSNAGITAGTLWSVWLPQVVHGSQVGAVPTVVVTTTLSTGEAIETLTVTLPALTASAATALTTPTVTTSPASLLTQHATFEAQFSISVTSALSTGDSVFIKLPNDFRQTTAAVSVLTTTGCTTLVTGTGLETVTQYNQYNSSPFLAYLYTASAASTTTLTPCVTIPGSSYYSGSVPISIYVINSASASVVQSGTLTLTVSPNSLGTPTITEQFFDATVHLWNQPNALYLVQFTTLGKINAGGSLSVLFPVSAFPSVDPCFDFAVFPAGTTCQNDVNHSYNSVSYNRVILSGWTSDFAPVANVKVYVSATSGTAASASILVLSNADDISTTKVIDSASLTLTFSSLSAPQAVSVDPFLSPQISLRNGEYGVLQFAITPATPLPATTSASTSAYVKVTLPAKGITNLYDPVTSLDTTAAAGFSQPAGSYLDCRFNGILASKCVITGQEISVYTPAASGLSAGTTYTLAITALGATTPSQIGFKAPTTVGYYEFLVGTYTTGTPDVLHEEATPWVYIGPGRFTAVSVTSYNKGAGQYTALHFSFKAGTAFAASSAGGVVIIEFPYDTTGTGKGWAQDLGTGLGNNAPIDCVAGTGTVANTQFSCTLVTGLVDTVKIKVSSFSAVSVGGLFDFTIAGIKNPAANLYDLSLKITSYVYDTSTPATPVYLPKDMAMVTVIDTTLVVTANPSTDSSGSSTLSVVTYASATANFLLSLDGSVTPSFSSSDKVLVKIQTDFQLSAPLTTCTFSTASPTCISFPITGWVLVSFTAAPATTAGLVLTLGPVTNPSYSPAINVFVSTLKERKSTAQITISFPQANLLTTGALTAAINSSNLNKVSGITETYCFKLTTTTIVPATGSVLVTFPSAYNGQIKGNSCFLGGETSDGNSALNIRCQLTVTDLRLSGFKADIAASSNIQPCVSVTNPASGTQQPFTYGTYRTTDSSAVIESATDNTGVTITAVVGTSMQFSAGAQYKPYVQAIYQSTGTTNTAELVVSVTTGVVLTKVVGYVKITFNPTTVTVATGGQLRCVWDSGTNKYLADSCTLATGVVQVFAPTTTDISAATPYTLTVTTINASIENGLVWGGAGTYALDIVVSTSDGSATYGQTRTYMSVGTDLFPLLEVAWDHASSDLFNRFTIKLTNTATAVPSWALGGRLAIEFPSFYGQMSYPNNHDIVSCATTGLTAVNPPNIQCYLEVGDATVGRNPAVIVTGFTGISAGATGIVIDLDSIKNPNVSGDDKIVWVQVSSLDVSAGWPGSVLARRRLDNLFVLKSVTPTNFPGINAPIASSQVLGATGVTYTFQMKNPATNILAGDILYIVMDSKVKPTITPVTLDTTNYDTASTVQYYSHFNFLILTMKAASVDINVAIKPFTNPIYQVAAGVSYFGYHVQNHQVIATFSSATTAANYFPALTTAALSVGRSDGLTGFNQNDILDWQFSITPTFSIPKGGAIVITLTTSSFNEAQCYNDVPNGSTFVGTYTCAISGKVATLKSTSAAIPATLIRIVANVKNASADDSVTVYTQYDAATAGTWIDQPAAVPITLTGTVSAPSYHEIPMQVNFPNKSIRAGATGAFKLAVKISTPLTMNAGTVEIDFPATAGEFAVAAGGTLQCTWNLSPLPLLASICTSTATPNPIMTVVVKAPALTNVPNGFVDILITTINADSPDAQGLVFPTTAKDYTITVRAKPDGSTPDKEGSHVFTLMGPALTSLAIDFGHRGNGKATYVKFTFVTGVAVPTGGSLRFLFPTMDENGNTLFAYDLGLGIRGGDPVPCFATGFTTQPTCTLIWGMNNANSPAYIQVTGLPAAGLVLGTTYTISFDGIMNPASAGTDDRLIYFRVYAYDATSAVLESQSNYYVYSLLSTPALDTTALSAPVFTGTPFSASAHMDVTLPTSPAQDSTSKFIIIYSFPIDSADTITDGTATTYDIHFSTKWAIMQRGATDLTTASLVFAGGHLSAIPTGTVVRVLHIKGGVVVGDHLTAPLATGDFEVGNALTALPVYPSSAGKMEGGSYGKIVVSYALKEPVPANGCITFSFKGSTAVLDGSVCMPSYSASASFKSSWSCTYAPKATGPPAVSETLTFTGLGALSIADNVNIVTRVTFTGTDIGGIQVATYADSTCTQKIETDNGAATTTPTITADTGTAQPIIYLKPPLVVNRLAIQSKTADLTFWFKPKTTLPASSNSHLKFTATTPLAVVSPQAFPSCSIATVATKIPVNCAFGASVTDLEVYARADLTAGTIYSLTLSTQGELLGANGFIQPATNNVQEITLQTYTSADTSAPADMGVIQFRTPGGAYPTLKVTPAHISAGKMNIFTIDLTTTVGIIAGNYLVVEFSMMTEDGSLPLFSPDLGLGVPTGTVVGVKSTTYTPTSCILKHGSSSLNIPAQVKCTGGTVAAAGTMTINIPAANPSLTSGSEDSEIVHLRVYTEDSSHLIREERSVFNIFAVDGTALTSVTEPTAAWPSSAPSAGSTSQTIDIAYTTTPIALIIIGSSLDLTTTSAAVDKYSGVNVLYIGSNPATPQHIAGLTAPATTTSVTVNVLAITTIGGKNLVTEANISNIAATVASVVPVPTITAALANMGTFGVSGSWQLQKLMITVTIHPIPANTYLEYTVGGNVDGSTYDAVDPGFLMLGSGFANENIKWKYDGSAPTKKFVVWGYSALAPGSYSIYIYALLRSSNGFSVTVYTDSALTSNLATGSTSSHPATSASTSLGTVTITATPSFKASTAITAISVDFTPQTEIVNGTGSGVYLDLSESPLGCAGAGTVTVAVTYTGSAETSAAPTYTSKVAYADNPTINIPTSSAITVLYTFSAPDCTPPAAGYVDIKVHTSLDGTAVLDELITTIWIATSASLTAFTMETFVLEVNSWSIVAMALTPSVSLVAGDLIIFEFPIYPVATNFAPGLGLSLASDSLVPIAESTNSVGGCWLGQGSITNAAAGLVFDTRITCTVTKPINSATPMSMYFPKIKTPSTAGSTAQFKALTFHAGAYVESKTASSTGVFTTTAAGSTSGTVTPASSHYYATSTYTFDLTLSGSHTAATGDYFMVELGSGYSVNGGAVSGDVKGVISSPAPCPCILISLTGITSPTPQITIPGVIVNPGPGSTPTLSIYPNLKTTGTCDGITTIASPTFTGGSLTTLSVTNMGASSTTFYQNQDIPVTVSFTTASGVPSTGSIVILFPAASFDTIQTFHIETSLVPSPLVSCVVATTQLTITGFAAIASSTIVTISSIYVPVLPAATTSSNGFTITTYAGATQLDSATATITISTPTNTYLRVTEFWPLHPALYGKDSSDPKGASVNVMPVVHFQTSHAMTAKTDNVVVTLPSDIFKPSTSTPLFAYFLSAGKRHYAYNVARAGSGPYTITVYAPAANGLTTSSEYDLVIGAHNNDADGLSFAATTNAKVETIENNGANTFTSTGLEVPGATVFAEFYVQPFSLNQSQKQPYLIHFKATTLAAKANNAEIVIQFPDYDSNPFSITHTSSTINCLVQVAGVADTAAVCRAYVGDSTSSFNAYRNPATVIINSLSADIAAADVIEVVLASIATPVSGRISDVTVFTREVTTSGVSAVKDYMTYRNVLTAQGVAAAAGTGSWSAAPTSVVVNAAAQTYTLSFSQSAVNIDALVVSFPAIYPYSSFLGTNTVTVTTAGTPTATSYIIPSAGLILIVLTPHVAMNATPVSIAIGGVTNVSHISTTASDAALTVYTSTSRQFIMSTFSCTGTIPTWTAATASITSNLADGSVPVTDSHVYAGRTADYSLVFQFPNTDIPKNGVFLFQFPAEFQSVSQTVYATSPGFSTSTCSGTTLTWTCSIPQKYTKANDITIHGRATSPTAIGATANFVITAYADAGKTQLIATNASAGTVTVVAGTKFSVPDDFHVPHQVVWQESLVRAGSNAMFTCKFKVGTALVVGTGSVTLTPLLNTQFGITLGATGRAVCIFHDLTNGDKQYMGSGCSLVSGVWTANTPVTKVIDTSVQWGLTIYSTGIFSSSTNNGPQFPANTVKSYSMTVVLSSGEEFQESVYNLVAAPTKYTINPIVYHQNQANSFYVLTLDAAIVANPTGYVSLIFPTTVSSLPAYDKYLGQAAIDGSDMGCSSDIGTTTSYTCSVVPVRNTYMSRNYAQLDLYGNSVSASGLKKVYFSGIKNPGSQNIIPWVAIQVTNAGLVTVFEKMYSFFMVTAPTTVTSTVKPSFLASITTPATNLKVGATSVSTTGFSLGEALAQYDFVVLVFPHPIASSSTVTGSALATIVSKKTIFCQASAAMASTDPFDLSGLTNPSYTITNPVLKAYIYSNHAQTFELDFSDAAQSYTLETIAAVGISIPMSGTGLKNVLLNYEITFSLPVDIASQGGFKITFPSNIALNSVCTAESWPATLVATNLGQVLCSASAQVVQVSYGVAKYTSGDVVKVIVWGKADTSFTSPMTVDIASYLDAPTFSQQNGSAAAAGTLVIAANTAPTSVSVPSYLMTTHSTIARVGDYGRLEFNITPTTKLDMGAGTLSLSFATGLTAVTIASPGAVRCLWISATGSTYLASACTWSTGATYDTLLVTAPASTDITANIQWTVRATTVMQGTEGFQFAAATPVAGQYLIMATAKGDGTTVSNYAEQKILLAPKLATAASLTYTGNSISSPTSLLFSITPSNSVGAGIENTGTASIVLSFDSAAMGVNLGNQYVSTTDQTDNFGDTSCVSKATFGTSVKCYLRRGELATQRRTELVLHKFTTLATTLSSVLLAPVTNPSALNSLVHVQVAVKTYAAGVYTYLHYQEFNYLYMTIATPTSTTGNTASLSAPPTPLTLSLAFAGASTMPTSGGLAIFILAEAVPVLSGVTIATHTIEIMANSHALIVEQVSGTQFANPILFTTFPQPPYAMTQTWLGYLYDNQVLKSSYVYTAISVPAATTPAANLNVDLADTLVVSGPFTSRPNHFSIRITPSLKLPAGGEIRISIPNTAFQTAGPNCSLDGGLLGASQCVYSSADNAYRITGFATYDGTGTPLPAILVMFTLRATSAVASGPVSFGITTYPTSSSGTLTSTIESGTVTKTYTITAANSLLNAQAVPWYQGQSSACLGQVATLSFHVTPRAVTYAYKDLVKITFFSTVDLAAGAVVVCVFSNGVNNVPSESGCTKSWTATLITITATVPEQLPLASSSSYTLFVSVRDSGSLTTDGFTLPTVAEVATLPLPGKTLWYLEVSDPVGPTKKEAGKFIALTCGPSFTSVSLSLGTLSLNSYTYLDLSFTPAHDIAIDGQIVIEFPTNNELVNVFPVDLGVGATVPTKIYCKGITGFASTSTCTVYPAAASGATSPALVKVSGHGVITAATASRILIAKVKTPAVGAEPIFNQASVAQMRVYTTTSSLTKSSINNDSKVRYPTTNSFTSSSPGASKSGAVSISATTTATDTSTLTFTFTDGSATTLGPNSGSIVLELDPSFLLPATITCGGMGTTCGLYPISGLNWVVGQVASGSGTYTTSDTVTAVLRSPEYNLAAGFSVKAYVYNGSGVWTDTFTATLPTLTPKTAAFTVSNPLNLNLNTYDIYTFVITPAAQSTIAKRVKIDFPSTYQWLDATCKVTTGLTAPSAASPISCVSDCMTTSCNKVITITNFLEANPALAITVSIGALSPSVSGATANFVVTVYNSLTGTDGAIETVGANPLTILNVDFPNLAWVAFNSNVVYDRTVQAGGIGDIYIRMVPKASVPAGTGSVQVVLPTGFVLVTGGTATCSVQSGMPYYQTQPILLKRMNFLVSAPCTWSTTTSTLTITLPPAVAKEWNGIGTKCSTLVLSSTGATGTQGYTTPTSAGYYTAKVTTFSGTTQLESSSPVLYLPPVNVPSSGYTFTAFTSSINTQNLFKVTFTTASAVPAGYLTFLNNVPLDIATIQLQFQTYQSFDPDLHMSYTKGAAVPCTAVSGIVPHGNLQCTFVPGDITVTTPLPAQVLINSFEAIAAGTTVVIHLLGVQNPFTNGLVPVVWTSVFRTSYDGSVTGIYSPAQPATPLDATTTDLGTAVSVLDTANILSLTNKYIDGTGSLSIPLTLGTAMSAGDAIFLSFPNTWFTLPSTGLTVAINDFTTKAAAITTPTMQIYPTAGVVTITLPTGTSLSTGTDYYIQLTGFLNPPYMDTCTSCPISYYTAVGKQVKDTYSSTTNNFWTDLSILPGKVSSFVFTATSLKANAINLTYTIGFSTVPRVPVGSTLQVTLPTTFPQLSTRSPQCSCSTTLKAATCAISSYGVILTGFGALAANQPVSVTITGAKNPGVVGAVSGFIVSVLNQSGKVIINDTPSPTVSILAADSAAGYTLTIVPQSFTAGITPNYVFTAVTTAILYSGTVLTLSVPIDFTIAKTLQCSRLSGISSYRSCGVSNNNSIVVVLNEALAASTSISITFVGIKNPLISATGTTAGGQQFGPFLLNANYDGTDVATSSATATSAFLTITPAPVYLQPSSFTLLPFNEGERGLYNITFTAPILIQSGANYAVRILFPSIYSSNLVTTSSPLFCTSIPLMQKCSVYQSNEIRFEVFLSDVSPLQPINLMIFGVTNPVQGSTGQFNIQLVNQVNGQILSATDTAGAFNVMPSPEQLFILSLSADTLYTGTVTNYRFSFDSNVQVLAKNGAIWIDWPSVYKGLFSQKGYQCSVTSQAVTASNCVWLKETNYLRTQIRVPAPTVRNQQNTGVTQRFTVNFLGLPNPKTAGQTQPFAIKYVDLDTSLVISSSADNIGNNTMTFQSGTATISLPVLAVSVTQGTYTNEVSVGLAIASYDAVRVVLSSDSPGLVFDPPELYYQFAWNLQAKFRVGATANAKTGVYKIIFTKYESGTVQRFQALEDLEITVLPATGNIPIVISPIANQPANVASLPVNVTLSQPTLYQLFVVLITTQGTNITITPSSLTFGPGMQTANFTILYNSGAVSGSVYGQVAGNGAGPYTALTVSTPFVVLPTVIAPPTLLYSNVSTIDRLSASAEVRLTAPATVYFMYSAFGTTSPTNTQLQNHQNVKGSVSQTFGVAFASVLTGNSTAQGYYSTSLNMNKLKDSSKYIVYFAYQGSDQKLSNVSSLRFTTLPSYQPAKFTIFTLIITDPNTVLTAVCKTLGVPCALLLFIGVDPNLIHSGRRLQSDFPYDFVMTMDRSQDAASPASQVSLLDSKKDILKAYLPTLSPTPSITGTVTTYNYTSPKFLVDPFINVITNTTVTIQVTQNTNGRIYGVILERLGPQPNAEQILARLDGVNQAVPEGHYANASCVGNGSAWLKFENLQYFRRYRVWLAGTNDLPGFPAVMSDSDVKFLNLTAGKLLSTVYEQTTLLTWRDAAEALIALASLWLLV